MVDPRVLYPRRLAHRALGIVLEQFGLTQMAMRLNPDDPTQALTGTEPGEVRFYEDLGGRSREPIAIVLLDEEGRGRVLVERVERLIRRNHLRDFQPRELGIDRRPGRPDIDAVVDLAEVVEVEGSRMQTLPQRVLPPSSRPMRAPVGIRAFGSGR